MILYFLLLLVAFCYALHKMCVDKGISPVGYLVGFVTGYILILLSASIAVVYFYGPNVLHDAEASKEILSFSPFAMMFQFLLFVFFRKKIASIPDFHDEDDAPRPPKDEKKDFSYFR